MTSVKVWTLKHNPFALGMSYKPVGCYVEANGPFDLGEGYKGYLVVSPKGKTFVAEALSGAFVGPSIEAVRKDIETGDLELMKRQVEDAIQQSKAVETIPAEEFWSLLR